MPKYLKILFIFQISLSFGNSQPIQSFSSERTDDVIFSTDQILCNRQNIINEYADNYTGTSVSNLELDWTGDVEACIEGTISDLAFEKTLGRINYFRRLVGITNPVVFNEVKNQKCQKAVLMMDAENTLDHYPTADWKCSSPEGIEAAGKSNLSYGGHTSAAITQYIRDAGSGNGAVGHRRWILYPKAHEFGFGSTNWGTALWVIGGTMTPDSIPDFVAYPSSGYFPKSLIYPRWSFSKKGANFENVTLEMRDENGNGIDLYLEEVANGYGDNTLVWVPSINLYDTENGTDHYFNISIDSIKIGSEYYSYNYSVLGIETQGDEAEVIINSPNCYGQNGSISLQIPRGYKNIMWSNGEMNVTEINNLDAGTYNVSIMDKLDCELVMEFDLSNDNLPKEIDQISGNFSSSVGMNEIYSTTLLGEGMYDWEITNGTLISGENTNEIEVKWEENNSSGTICVKYTDVSGCESNQFCTEVELTTSSSKEFSNNNNLRIFPNPFTDNLNISYKSNEIISIHIYDHSGKEIIRKKLLEDGQIQINNPGLSAGIYIVKINTQNDQYCAKLIKI